MDNRCDQNNRMILMMINNFGLVIIEIFLFEKELPIHIKLYKQ